MALFSSVSSVSSGGDGLFTADLVRRGRKYVGGEVVGWEKERKKGREKGGKVYEVSCFVLGGDA